MCEQIVVMLNRTKEKMCYELSSILSSNAICSFYLKFVQVIACWCKLQFIWDYLCLSRNLATWLASNFNHLWTYQQVLPFVIVTLPSSPSLLISAISSLRPESLTISFTLHIFSQLQSFTTVFAFFFSFELWALLIHHHPASYCSGYPMTHLKLIFS